MTVLVGYATEHGSTRAIAGRIAALLRRSGIAAELRALKAVDNLDRFDALVLGSAVHNQKWLPEALEFVARQRGQFGRRPVWLFSVGMPAALPRAFRAMAESEAPKIIAPFRAALNLRQHQLFSGAIRPEDLSRWGRLFFRACGCRYGDYRDWDRIERWAAEIAADCAAAGAAQRSA